MMPQDFVVETWHQWNKERGGEEEAVTTRLEAKTKK